MRIEDTIQSLSILLKHFGVSMDDVIRYSLLATAAILAIVALPYLFRKVHTGHWFPERPDYRCLDCGYAGPVKLRRQGSFWVETLLWGTFFFPGIFYSSWRSARRIAYCPDCKSIDLSRIEPSGTIAEASFSAAHIDPEDPPSVQ